MHQTPTLLFQFNEIISSERASLHQLCPEDKTLPVTAVTILHTRDLFAVIANVVNAWMALIANAGFLWGRLRSLCPVVRHSALARGSRQTKDNPMSNCFIAFSLRHSPVIRFPVYLDQMGVFARIIVWKFRLPLRC